MVWVIVREAHHKQTSFSDGNNMNIELDGNEIGSNLAVQGGLVNELVKLRNDGN